MPDTSYPLSHRSPTVTRERETCPRLQEKKGGSERLGNVTGVTWLLGVRQDSSLSRPDSLARGGLLEAAGERGSGDMRPSQKRAPRGRRTHARWLC